MLLFHFDGLIKNLTIENQNELTKKKGKGVKHSRHNPDLKWPKLAENSTHKKLNPLYDITRTMKIENGTLKKV